MRNASEQISHDHLGISLRLLDMRMFVGVDKDV